MLWPTAKRVHANGLILPFVCAAAALGAFSGCAQSSGGDSVPPPISYCPYLPSLTFSNPVTVQGNAFYQYRKDGNGEVQDGGARIEAASAASAAYAVTINSQTYAYTSTASPTLSAILNGIAAAINAGSATSGARATATAADVRVAPIGSPATPLTITVGAHLTLFSHGAAKPIRWAEIRVSDSSGAVRQCAETDANGGFSFQLPRDTGTYTVEVTSRSANSHAQAYVLKSPNTNVHYSLSNQVDSSANSSNKVYVASATSSAIEGGAFNILDQIHNANQFMRAETANCATASDPTYFAGCASGFTTAPMLYAYWAKGVNPGDYFGISDHVSFYLLGTHHLFLLCEDGNSGDCDHFDNSIIVHEYGHFIEETYGRMNSPGGSHSGTRIIDPRLSWGEGWANFYQAAVTRQPFYRDSVGNIDCYLLDGNATSCTDYGFTVNLETNATVAASGDEAATYESIQTDTPTTLGEGNFHEFSVSRVLWHALGASYNADSAHPNSTTHSTSTFSEIWTVIAGSAGYRSDAYAFRNVGLIHKLQQSMAGASDWSTIRTNEKQRGNLTDYATPVTLGAAACAQAITPRNSHYGTTLDLSDQFNNNDFYWFRHSGGALNVQVSCTVGAGNRCKGDAVGNDLDLYLWKDAYVFGRDSTLVASSARSNASTEVVAFDSLPAGDYMINVNVDRSNSNGTGLATNYQLLINGQKACPAP